MPTTSAICSECRELVVVVWSEDPECNGDKFYISTVEGVCVNAPDKRNPYHSVNPYELSL